MLNADGALAEVHPVRRRRVPWRRRGIATTLLAVASAAAAHATLVLGTLEFTPDPPVPGAPLEVRLRLEDPGLVGVEDAHVRIELRPAGAAVPTSGNADPAAEDVAPALVASDPFDETTPGGYVATVTAPAPGAYTVTVRDTTYRQEEAIANVQVEVGTAAVGSVPFVLPPTATAPRSALTWVLWLVGVPVAAGILVTVLVLRSGPKPREVAG